MLSLPCLLRIMLHLLGHTPGKDGELDIGLVGVALAPSGNVFALLVASVLRGDILVHIQPAARLHQGKSRYQPRPSSL